MKYSRWDKELGRRVEILAVIIPVHPAGARLCYSYLSMRFSRLGLNDVCFGLYGLSVPLFGLCSFNSSFFRSLFLRR